MRILANENIPALVVSELRSAGHDIVSVKEVMRGASDIEDLSRAQNERRLIITHDKDSGEMAFGIGLPAECGVVLFRLSGDDPESDMRRMLDALQSRTDWAGHFSVVDEEKIRIKPLKFSDQ